MSTTKNFFRASAEDFKKIPGSPIVYWVSEKMVEVFANKSISKYGTPRQGMSTCDVNRFVFFWHEVSFRYIGISKSSERSRWVQYNKGGDYRKWYGNRDWIVRWEIDGSKLRNAGALLRNSDYYFLPFIAWSKISSQGTGFRFFEKGFLFDGAGGALFLDDGTFTYQVIALLNSIVVEKLLNLISPTINFNESHIGNIPGVIVRQVEPNVTELMNISKSDWDEYETSWDFKVNPLVCEARKANGEITLANAWKAVFARRMEWATRMKELEEENNKLFIEAYGLEDELSPEVKWKDVSITGNPFYRYKVVGESLENHPDLELRAKADTVKELISYAVGCMMGRYSLEKDTWVCAT